MRWITSLITFALLASGCSSSPSAAKQIPLFLLKFPPKSFAYPVGESDFATERNDWRDGWYNAQDFGDNRHLGEDWNKSTGGNSDCGDPVYAAADGSIVFAGDAGPGWGNVLILEHTAEDGTQLQTLYGHMETLIKTEGSVNRRDQIATIGGAGGRYPCHLHFEMRWRNCSSWGKPGSGYADDREGWVDPSEFIERQRELTPPR